MNADQKRELATLIVLLGGLAAAAFAGCSGDVQRDPTPSGAGGGGGAGGSDVTAPSVAHGGCYDTFECGQMVGLFGCLQCESDACPDEVVACEAEPDCAAYGTCEAACVDDACYDQCQSAHPAGYAAFRPLLTCTACREACQSFDCPLLAHPPVACP